jgi:hypothetical protein
MPSLLTTLLNASSSWWGGLSFNVDMPVTPQPDVGGSSSPSRDDRIEPHWTADQALLENHQRLALARTRITEARAGLNPVRRSPRVVCAPHDNCRTVITGRMGEVCEVLDRLVAREAATMRAHARTTTLR